jgi:hypothetical protein
VYEIHCLPVEWWIDHDFFYNSVMSAGVLFCLQTALALP